MTRNALYVFLIAISLMLLAGQAAAQAGCFQHRVATVRAPMNIRQSHSADSAVVRGAAAGESFAVSSSTQGRSYCWLNISEGWIAWTTRVRAGGTSAPPAEQTTQTTDIDNCCFVNRQCQSDKEWNDGYWAFQRNECPVGQRTTQQTTAQPVNGASAQVDNCCFAGWHCGSDAEWVRGYWAYQNNQCGAGASLSMGSRVGNIVIEGSETFQIWVKAGLELLRTRAPQWYDYVQGATRKLVERPAGTYVFVDVAGAAHHTAWDANDYPNELNIYTIAHEMIHEACHIYQYRRGDSRETVYLEKECVEREIEAMPFFEPNDRWGRRAQLIWVAANLIDDPSLWWWGEVAECRWATPYGVGC